MLAPDLYFTLNTGARIPMIGLGTAGINGPDITLRTLNDALQMGYRLIDTAAIYENEKNIGYALEKLLPKFNLTRKDIFITTKPHPKDIGENTSKAIAKSLKDLNCGYIDLYLINWPGTIEVSPDDRENFILRNSSWKIMVHAVKKKIIRQIGVCGNTVRHLQQLLAHCHGITPSVNQVEFHPFCRDRKLLDLCRPKNIFVQAYSSLGGSKWSDLINHECVTKCANKLGKTPAQILLRWAVQQEVGVIPTSHDRGHLFSNMQLDFNIPLEDMLILSTLETRVRYDVNPHVV
ncbi:unnamed protein product [Psylliodes chrysocephalus]|uniref:NADP-dependent oxidoreductase domain-containing protein n=1 Tax=Psylliodes chrysocephalus TaxID=3402493 RepID=A0A9P0GER9_9CUCU|nr:unnamed protein product [Psylliodes chrysocephala]